MLRTYVFSSIYDGTAVLIEAVDIDSAWKKLAENHIKENYLLEGSHV